MKNKKSIEKRLGITSYPEYVTTNLAEYAVTDWATYLIRAKQMFESGQVFAAQRIVSDCLRHSKWDESFSQEVHKAIPRIIATMKDDDMYMSFVAEIKHKYNLGILSETDVYPFKKEFSIIHIMGDKT